jgi:hypothetical protein
MSRFEERLWRELVREHGEELARIAPRAKRGRIARPRLLAGTTVGIAGVGTAIALVLGAASSTPAFAVTQNRDGTVSIVIKQFDAIHGVNIRLAALGYRARFVEVAAGCAVPQPRALAAARARVYRNVHPVTVKQWLLRARFDPRTIPAGRTLVLPAFRVGERINFSTVHTVAGAAPACLPIPLAGRIPPVARKPLIAPGLHCIATAGRTSSERRSSGKSGPPPAGNGGPMPITASSGNNVVRLVCPAGALALPRAAARAGGRHR